MDYQKRDYQKYFLQKGDKGFSVARNKYIIEKTIKITDQRRELKRKMMEEGMRERVDMSTSYLFSPKGATMQNDIVKYFGVDELMRLKGQDTKAKLMQPLITKYKQGGDN